MRSSVLESVDILDLRHYTSAELRTLLEAEAHAWAQKMAWDYRSSAEMILRYVDSKILPGYVALENNHIVGYSFFVYEGSKGVVGDLFVSPGRNHSVRERLLTHVLETLQQTPGIHRVEAQLLIHDTGEVNAVFEHEGFQSFRRLFMELPLATPTSLVTPFPEEVTIRGWQEMDFQPSAAVITAAYNGHIDSEINDQYRTANGSLRFLNNIIRFPGCGTFDASSSFVAINRYTGVILGLLLCSRVREDVGHVTQVCLLPEHRGRGIGESLLAACTRDLRARNFSQLTLTVTEANHRAVELYHHLGFKTTRVFDAFVWEG